MHFASRRPEQLPLIECASIGTRVVVFVADLQQQQQRKLKMSRR